MNPIVTGDRLKDRWTIMRETTRNLMICEALKKSLTESSDVWLIQEIEQSLLLINDCAKSIYDQSGEHS